MKIKIIWPKTKLEKIDLIAKVGTVTAISVITIDVIIAIFYLLIRNHIIHLGFN